VKDVKPGWQRRSTHSEPPVHAPNAALLIDFDNVTMGIRSDLQDQLRRLLNSEIIKGKVAVQRAYADWRRYPQYIVPLSEASIDLIFAPAFGSNKKNATDIRLAIDALELVFTRPEIGTFILLSGDSDFSSLVLKLKEYGKYIIGVGLRESSSDLLIQNCDEYYSYTEATGLAKEGDGVSAQRDPWELVVEAVTQMKREDDVMRSDRLKQVMQAIDPNFSEKNAGFSRFSRFVMEAGQRGLLLLEKMENGQYAVDVGLNANVPPDEEAELRKGAAPAKEPATKSRRKRTPRRRETPVPSRLSLAEAFELLRQALLVLGAVGEESSPADDARARMAVLLGDESDPIFERPRFQRLLRQAHDANVIELVKADEGYVLRLGPKGMAEAQEPAGEDAAEQPPVPPSEPATPTPEKRTRKRRSTARKTAKGRGRSGDTKSEEAPQEQAPPASPPAKPAATKADEGAKRNPRYRPGSRGRSDTGRRPSSDDSAEQAQPKRDATPTPPVSDPATPVSRRSVRGRRGSRGRRPPPTQPTTPKADAPSSPEPPQRSESTPQDDPSSGRSLQRRVLGTGDGSPETNVGGAAAGDEGGKHVAQGLDG
jgi:uncharacterized protein (TIGR00288 family)